MTITSFPAKIDPTSGMTLGVRSLSTNWWEDTFDSWLLKHEDGANNHTLTLVLKIHLNPFLPHTARLPRGLRMLYFDSDKTPILVRPWARSEWSQFVTRFKRECALWNNRFWLMPQADFKLLDVKLGSKTVRPNIYCHLYIDVVNTKAGSHRSITVVNLDKATNSSFRSDSLNYSSEDINREPTDMKDEKGKPLLFSTVAHEIGHALGLPHIGVTHSDPLCNVAMYANDYLPDGAQPFLPAVIQDGSNAQVCYGTLGPPDRSKNVMGMGSVFDETNAKPWVDRLALHGVTGADKWKVSLKPVPPTKL